MSTLFNPQHHLIGIEVNLFGPTGETSARLALDTGASSTLISKEILELIGYPQRQPTSWFWVLRAMTGEDPIRPENRGKVREMTDAWLQWGQEHAHLL